MKIRPHKTYKSMSSLFLQLLLLKLCISPAAASFMRVFGFINITVSNADEFVQIFACSNDQPTNVSLTLHQTQHNVYQVVDKSTPMNTTIAVDDIISDRHDHLEVPNGLQLTSEYEVDVHAFHTSVGLSDGYLVPLLTQNSTEFYVVGWSGPSYSGLVVAAGFPDTCVEIFQLKAGETELTRIYDIFLPTALTISQAVFGDNDTTGFFINSTRPVSVYTGVACGKVPTDVSYCDHLIEFIPPISELGTAHVVPPIAGRMVSAGYVVRVLATVDATTVTWTTSKGTATPASPTTLQQTKFVELDVADTDAAALVTCSKPCVVMQYNKGRDAGGSITEVNTDPFMMLTVPVDHYVSAACFTTPNALYRDLILAYKIAYNNYLSVVTLATTTADLRFDGAPITGWTTIGTYSFASFPVTHDTHSISVTTGSTATFAAYLYGHSSSSSYNAHGYPVAYKMLGTPATQEVEQTSTPVIVHNVSSVACNTPATTSGASVFEFSTDPDEIVDYGINLTAKISNGITLNSACSVAYLNSLNNLTIKMFQEVNNRICSGQLCPYLKHPSTGLLVAVDARQPSTFVNFNSPTVTSLSETAMYAGLLETDLLAFPACRDEVCDYLAEFSNWRDIGGATGLSTGQMVAPPTGCPALTFDADKFTPNDIFCDFQF